MKVPALLLTDTNLLLFTIKLHKMETTEKPEQPRGGIHNYFQGATIHNMVINGNMNKNASESYNSTEEHKRLTPEQVVQTLKQCPEFFEKNASYSIAFCVCRDMYHMGDNATQFEKMLIERGINIPLGTINNSLSRKPFMRYHIDKWDEMNAASIVLKTRDTFIEKSQNVLIEKKEIA